MGFPLHHQKFNGEQKATESEYPSFSGSTLSGETKTPRSQERIHAGQGSLPFRVGTLECETGLGDSCVVFFYNIYIYILFCIEGKPP